MEWTKEDAAFLRDYRHQLDSDDIKLKEEIKQRLLNDKYIIHVLDNKELQDNDAESDDYFGVNILPYFIIPGVQTNTMNYLCYECSAEPRSRWENVTVEKYQRITFYILCHEKNIIERTTSLARHDLLAALVMRTFNFAVLSCGRIELISDLASVTDNNFVTRTMIFSAKTDANLVKTIGGKPRIVNHRTNFSEN